MRRRWYWRGHCAGTELYRAVEGWVRGTLESGSPCGVVRGEMGPWRSLVLEGLMK
jgi:hypothetical protein